MEPTLKLTQDQIDFFNREGYLALDAITPPDEVEKIRQIYDRLFDQRAGHEEGKQFDLAGTDEAGKAPTLPQLLEPSKYAPELLDTRFRANATALAQQLLGPAAAFRHEHMIFKPAHYGAETPWHQDQAYHDPAFVYGTLNVWMPLQEATLENGCMQFVPGSHGWDVLPHHSIGNDPRVHGLEVDHPEYYESRAVACPVPAGGCTLHRSYSLHYAGANNSEIPRRAYILVFAVPPVAREKPLRFHWLETRKTAREAREQAWKEKQPQPAMG